MHTNKLNPASEVAITFDCGGDTLLGIVHGGKASPCIGVVMLVGGPQYRIGSHRQFVIFARAFAKDGYPVMRFDHRGVGDSAGERRSFDDLDEDILSSIDALYSLYPELQGIVLIGLCDSASAAMIYGPRDPRVLGLVLINPWVRTSASHANISLRYYYRRRLLQKSFWRKFFGGKASILSAMREVTGVVRAAMGSSTNDKESSDFVPRMCRGLSQFSGEVQFILSGSDLTAKEFMSLSSRSGEWARLIDRKSTSVEIFEGANHTLSHESDTIKAIERISQWLNRVTRAAASRDQKHSNVYRNT